MFLVFDEINVVSCLDYIYNIYICHQCRSPGLFALGSRVVMTNQANMVISDAKSGLTRAIAVALSESFSPQLVSQYFTRKKLLKKLESYGNDAGINAFLDSMRASSPTRRSSDAEHQDSWTVSERKTILLTFVFGIIDYARS